ncbi:2-oxo acid dehydrogenase subunit E2 [Streptomyces sp. NPDC001793]|uniref:2-oxo acid dehydrogenase subunit E2 n=1 Tax=Streptomyces sp. NPDC001793 TaxID=3154657 RepID=UPI00332FC56A
MAPCCLAVRSAESCARSNSTPPHGGWKPSTSTGQPPTPDAREVPELNGCWLDCRFTAGAEARLGVAVSLRGGGLVAPALRHADALELPYFMTQLKDLATRVRNGRLPGSEVADLR